MCCSNSLTCDTVRCRAVTQNPAMAQEPAGFLHAFVTVFATPSEGCVMATAAHDTRRRLQYADAQPGTPAGTGACTARDPASARARECVMRRRESGIFYDASRLVVPEQMSRVRAGLAEVEREVLGAAAVHVCFSSAHVFSVLLSSCVVVSVRFAEDGVQVADCAVDRRLAAALAPRLARTGTELSAKKDKAEDTADEHGVPATCSAGYLTPQFAVVAHGDGCISVVCSRKASSTNPLFAPHAGLQPQEALQVVCSVEIASAACRILVNADLDLVAAQTGTAIHFLALSGDLSLHHTRSIALAGDETVILSSWVPFKPRTIMVVTKHKLFPSTVSAKTLFIVAPVITSQASRTSKSMHTYTSRPSPPRPASAVSTPAKTPLGSRIRRQSPSFLNHAGGGGGGGEGGMRGISHRCARVSPEILRRLNMSRHPYLQARHHWLEVVIPWSFQGHWSQ